MVESNSKRDQSIVRISWTSILINFILAAFKLFAGFMVNSVAIITDGINNVSDVMSSTITIFGTRLSEKEPDREHPFGVHTRKSLREELQHKVMELYPEYDIVIDVDYDFTE